jgi:hypothetical protein
MRKLLLAAVAALALAAAAPALAADPTTSGSATITDNVGTIVSNTSVPNTPADDGGAITFPIASGLTLAQITHLSAEFNVTDDDCSAGSPRFAINFGPNKNVFVYLDPTPSASGGCTANTWLSTGNLVGTTEDCRVDPSQISPGTQCTTTWAEAVALMGSQPILSISIASDSGWSQADQEQTIQVRNVKINNDTFLAPEAPKPPKVNPTTACKAQQASLGRAAFNELWAKDGTSNGFGKCVSAAAKARNLSAMHTQIMNAAKTCKAKGLKGEKLGQCVAATDRVAATKTEAQERKDARKRGR